VNSTPLSPFMLVGLLSSNEYQIKIKITFVLKRSKIVEGEEGRGRKRKGGKRVYHLPCFGLYNANYLHVCFNGSCVFYLELNKMLCHVKILYFFVLRLLHASCVSALLRACVLRVCAIACLRLACLRFFCVPASCVSASLLPCCR
jgi:hypothetical protein